MSLLRPVALVGLRLDRRLGRQAVSGRRQRGMALIVVLATLAVLSVSIVEFVYNTRINLYLAQNHRDEVKAYFLARSGINIQRLTLAYQLETLAEGGMMADFMQRSQFQIWRYIPTLAPIITSGALTAGDLGEVDLTETAATGFGGLHGTVVFHDVVPEEGKINLNEFAAREIDQESLMRMCQLVAPATHDAMLGFDEREMLEDRFDMIAAIIDHVDSDSDLTTISPDCVAERGGAGNEISRYIDAAWEPKNEPFVTVDELRMVPGVTPGFMRQFGEQFTVYPVTGKFYPNQATFIDWYGFLCTNVLNVQDTENFSPCMVPDVAAQAAYSALILEGYVRFFGDPIRVLTLLMAGGSGSFVPEEVGRGRMVPFGSNNGFPGTVDNLIGAAAAPEIQQFYMFYADPMLLAAFGIVHGQPLVPPARIVEFDTAGMRGKVEVGNPSIYTISTTGEYGSASRTISAVVNLTAYPEERIMYWREF